MPSFSQMVYVSYNHASWAYTAPPPPQRVGDRAAIFALGPIVIMEEVIMSTLEDDRLIDNLKF